jgi:MOSC domain-containing protein YiiM
MGKVVGLYISPRVGEFMQPQTAVRALAGKGLEGDRYAAGQGTYSRIARQAARHISLIGREAIQAANEELTQRGLAPFEPVETRRNIIVEGYDVHKLIGQEFRIGHVRLRGSEPTRPCHIPSAVAGKIGFAEAFHNRGGVRAEVLSDGMIAIGDALIAHVSPG